MAMRDKMRTNSPVQRGMTPAAPTAETLAISRHTKVRRAAGISETQKMDVEKHDLPDSMRRREGKWGGKWGGKRGDPFGDKEGAEVKYRTMRWW
jgi:hypothetical protein